MPERHEQLIQPKVTDEAANSEITVTTVDIQVTEEAVVMCHKYSSLECRAPEGGTYEPSCPNVYAKCWQYRIWNR